MSGYTKLNLAEDVENSAEKFGMGDVLATHFVRDDLDAKQFGLSLQRLKPNQRMPFGHNHKQHHIRAPSHLGPPCLTTSDDLA